MQISEVSDRQEASLSLSPYLSPGLGRGDNSSMTSRLRIPFRAPHSINSGGEKHADRVGLRVGAPLGAATHIIQITYGDVPTYAMDNDAFTTSWYTIATFVRVAGRSAIFHAYRTICLSPIRLSNNAQPGAYCSIHSGNDQVKLQKQNGGRGKGKKRK